MKVAGVILAAGRSQRFGEQKLLRNIGGRRIIEWSISAIQGSGADPLLAVVSRGMTDSFPPSFIIIENDRQELGISYSISLAISNVGKCDGILFHLADQPFVDSDLLRRMITLFKNGKKIVAASVGGEPRNPMIFQSSLFSELLALSGDRGARSVALNHMDQVVMQEVDASILMDIDTQSDLENARKFRE
ncbi:MAG: nucleotidyltransferase family protein [Thermoplasmatales archaeon]